MLSRALVPSVLCVSAFWPLHALACINSMDGSPKDFTQFFRVDLWKTARAGQPVNGEATVVVEE